MLWRVQVLLLVQLLLFYQGILLTRPRFLTLPKDGEVFMLNQLEVDLPCTSTGSPQPKIINWLIDDKQVDFSSNLLRFDGSLRFPRIQRADAGHYQCIAKNKDGGVVSEKRRIIVAVFDRIEKPRRETITKRWNDYLQLDPPAFVCDPPPKYLWKKNGAVIQETENLKVTANGTLFISNLDERDMGTYQLILENTFLRNKGVLNAAQEARVVDLKIYGKDFSNSLKIIHSSPRQIAGEDKTAKVTLECFVNGIPGGTVVTIRWFKYDEFGDQKPKPVLQSEKYVWRDQNRRLEINNPTNRYDNGRFLCATYANNEQKDTRDVFLDVFAPPIFLLKPSPTIGYTDNRTSINCTTSGPPYWKQRWYRNGIPVKPDGNRIIIHRNHTISIKKLNWEDHGIFQCAAENYAALNFFPITVEVKNISARIINYFRDLYVGRDSIVQVPCVAIGAPKPKISWLFNQTTINPAVAKYDIVENGSLIINGMTKDENGYYTCHASNYAIDQREVKVWIVVLTRFVKIPEKTTYARRGANIYLPCEVEHDPNINVTIQWRYNDLVVSDDHYQIQEDGALIIKFANEDDNGREFACHVFSYGGNLTATTTIILVQLPMTPSSPRAVEIQPYSIELAWDAPADGGSALTGYTLYMRNYTQVGFTLLVILPATDTSYLVTNLLAGSMHKFQVSAMNKFGSGDPSDETKWYETKALAPSRAPSEFRAIHRGKDSITLSWTIPPRETHNGVLLGYYIAYRLSGLKESIYPFTNIDVKGGEKLTYKIVGLPLFTRYNIKIAAYNRAGVGTWSHVVVVETMQGIPTAAPTNVSVSAINDSAVYVSFNSPPQTQWNGKLTKIVARTWPPDRPQDQQTYETDYDASSLHHQTFILLGLKADTDYILSISVATNGGNSPGSDWVQFRTREGIPDAVRDLQISGIYSDAFTVSWKLPKITAGQLRGYRIKWRVYGVGDWAWQEFTEGPAATGAVISNLNSKIRYEVKVAAFTSRGEGTYMSASVTTIESPELPSAPSNLKAYVIWGNNISLAFTPGYSGRAVIHYYLIEYNNDTAYHMNPKGAIWRLIRNLTKILENPANITRLKPSTTYRFRMRAFNRVGPSPYSNISADITTSEGVPDKPPTHVYAEATEREALLIRWAPPSHDSWNSGSIKYEFLIKLKGKEKLEERRKHPTLILSDTTATSYLARGLQKYSDYNITMRLFNDKGYGPWSKPVFAMTSEDYPESAPCCVQVTFLGTSTVTLSWGEVDKKHRNGVILGYKVYYQIKDVEHTELFKDFHGASTLTGQVLGLAGFTDYEFRLLAYTRVGGIFKGSPIIRKTKEGIPGRPKDVRFFPIKFDYTSARWNSPTRPNGVITGYEVKYRKKEEGSKWVTYQDEIQLYRREAKVRGLVYNHWYLFEVRAQTAIGWGDAATEEVLITRERAKPDSPVLLPIPNTDIHTKSVLVKWSPRYDGKSPIRSYNLEYNEEGSGWKRYRFGIPPVYDIGAEVNELEVLKLKPATKYQFQIRASNDLGDSEWSMKSKLITTNSEVQRGGPVDARVIKKTQTTMLIQWDPPIVVGISGKLRGYKVKYKDVARIDDFKYSSVPSTQTELLLSNLHVFTAYEVRVGAFNDKGRGIWSPYYRWRTGEDRPLVAPYDVNYHIQGGNFIRITWTHPSSELIRGYKLGYKVETVFVEGEQKRRKRRSLVAVCPFKPTVETHLAGPEDNEITLKNLRKYARYYVTVRVYNTFMDGPKSARLYFDTPKGVPGPPYILSTRVYMDGVDVDFEKPCEPNGRILRYKAVLRDKITGTELGDPKYPIPERLIIRNLNSLTEYTVELAAQTSKGYGHAASFTFTTYRFMERSPGPPGAPEIYLNRPGMLMLKWKTGDTGNVRVDKYFLEYRTTSRAWQEYRTILYEEMGFVGSWGVSQVVGLNPGTVYRFRVKSQTRYGISKFSLSSKPITALKDQGSGPIYKEIWFIFLLVIVFLLILIIIGVVCYRCKHKKTKYKPEDPKYNFSSFEMAMVSNADDESAQHLLPPSHGGSAHASIASSKRTGKHNDTSSIVKSSIHGDDDDTDEEMRRRDKKFQDEENIASHYSKNPVHKTWQDSLDQKTKKQILDEYSKNPPDERKKKVSQERSERPRVRPGKKDMTLEKNLARSDPQLANPDNARYATVNKPPQQRRPGKKPIDQELTRSQPDLNRDSPRSETQVNRAPSFLRATDRGDSDTESFQDVFDKEKTKRELAMDLESKIPPFYPPSAAPPPYDYHGAPPAYTPSESDDYNNEMDEPPINGHIYNNYPYGKPRYSDNSDFSDHGRAPQYPRYIPPKRDAPPNRGYAPERKSTSYDRDNVERNPPYPEYAPPPPKARYSLPPPQMADDEELEDDMDMSGDMTLV